MLISDEYRELNRELHARGKYGISGAKWAAQVYALAKAYDVASMLDYGCGQGTLGAALFDRFPEPPFTFAEYDPAIEGKDSDPDPAELVVCGDVLEHIEPECLDAVLDHIRDLTKKVAFLVVATRPAMKTLSDGRNAHLIVEPALWWIPKLLDRWDLRSFKDLGGEFMMIGAAR